MYSSGVEEGRAPPRSGTTPFEERPVDGNSSRGIVVICTLGWYLSSAMLSYSRLLVLFRSRKSTVRRQSSSRPLYITPLLMLILYYHVPFPVPLLTSPCAWCWVLQLTSLAIFFAGIYGWRIAVLDNLEMRFQVSACASTKGESWNAPRSVQSNRARTDIGASQPLPTPAHGGAAKARTGSSQRDST